MSDKALSNSSTLHDVGVGVPVLPRVTPASEVRDGSADPWMHWISVKHAAKLFDVSEATIYRWIKQRAGFPQPVKLSPGCSRLSLGRLLELVASLEAGK